MLGELGVLPEAVARTLVPTAGFGSVLVYEYLDVDIQEVHRVLVERLDDFLLFACGGLPGEAYASDLASGCGYGLLSGSNVGCGRSG